MCRTTAGQLAANAWSSGLQMLPREQVSQRALSAAAPNELSRIARAGASEATSAQEHTMSIRVLSPALPCPPAMVGRTGSPPQRRVKGRRPKGCPWPAPSAATNAPSPDGGDTTKPQERGGSSPRRGASALASLQPPSKACIRTDWPTAGNATK